MSKYTKVYTYPHRGNVGADDSRRAKVGWRVKRGQPEGTYILESIWAEHPHVQNVARGIAYRMGAIAAATLAAHPSDQGRSLNPRIEVVQGDRTDWHVLMVVGGSPGQLPSFDSGMTDADLSDGEATALAAAWSIEYGRRSYNDKTGKRQPTTQGIGALRAALSSV